MKLIVFLLSLGLAAPTVTADTNKVTACKVTKKKKPKKRKWKPRTCPAPRVVVVQECACPEGPPGPAGERGPRGYAGLNMGAGYMFSAFTALHDYAWAHGPSIRFTSRLSRSKELQLELGWAIGRDRAVMAQALVKHRFEAARWFWVGGGFYGHVIGLRKGRDTGYYGGLQAQVGVKERIGNLKFQLGVGPSVVLATFDNSGTDFAVGAVGSAGVTYRW